MTNNKKLLLGVSSMTVLALAALQGCSSDAATGGSAGAATAGATAAGASGMAATAGGGSSGMTSTTAGGGMTATGGGGASAGTGGAAAGSGGSTAGAGGSTAGAGGSTAGAGGSTAGAAGAAGAPSADCTKWCSGAMGLNTACPADSVNAAVNTEAKCIAACTGPTSTGDMGLSCWVKHLGFAIATTDAAMKKLHCGHASGKAANGSCNVIQ